MRETPSTTCQIEPKAMAEFFYNRPELLKSFIEEVFDIIKDKHDYACAQSHEKFKEEEEKFERFKNVLGQQ